MFKGDELAKAYRINAIPTLVIINKGRTIAKAKVGASGNPEKDLREAITKALAK
ncbi:MAG: thioredoxin family protein [Planctomycetota bacterium]|nr:thioredoxin family protein [Planctomycetota bacterium]MDA1261368.1 thioredoxin family protein [Planctomycetota bacterium]